MKYRFAVAWVLLCVIFPVKAADIAREIYASSDRGGMFAELGLVAAAINLPLVGFNDRTIEKSDDNFFELGILLTGRAEYKRFFAEFIEHSFSDLTVGYSLLAEDNKELELVFSNLFETVSRNEFAGLETIKNRKGDFNAGIRGSYFLDNSIYQFEILRDIRDSHNGFIGSLQVGRHAQVRNWNFQALLGLRYFSDNVTNHFFGVSSSEATTTLPAYEADEAVVPTLHFGAALPLSENVVLRAAIEYSPLPDSVSDSPLAQGNSIYFSQLGIYYVFGS